ncbi:hypothetical protein DSECCO2_305200 [anaerobic digester metagenome]
MPFRSRAQQHRRAARAGADHAPRLDEGLHGPAPVVLAGAELEGHMAVRGVRQKSGGPGHGVLVRGPKTVFAGLEAGHALEKIHQVEGAAAAIGRGRLQENGPRRGVLPEAVAVQAEALDVAAVAGPPEEAAGQGRREVQNAVRRAGPGRVQPGEQLGRGQGPVLAQARQKLGAGQRVDAVDVAQQCGSALESVEADQARLEPAALEPAENGLGLQEIAEPGQIDDLGVHADGSNKRRAKTSRALPEGRDGPTRPRPCPESRSCRLRTGTRPGLPCRRRPGTRKR